MVILLSSFRNTLFWLNVIFLLHVLSTKSVQGEGDIFINETIEAKLTKLNFNYTWCPDWINQIPENLTQNDKYQSKIRELCSEIVENDQTELIEQDKFMETSRKKDKIDVMINNIIMRLSEYNETKKEFLNERNYTIPEKNEECYWVLFEHFRNYCVDMTLEPYAKRYKYLLARVCEADWLTEGKFHASCKTVCGGISLYT